jgi:hypothetical protein
LFDSTNGQSRLDRTDGLAVGYRAIDGLIKFPWPAAQLNLIASGTGNVYRPEAVGSDGPADLGLVEYRITCLGIMPVMARQTGGILRVVTEHDRHVLATALRDVLPPFFVFASQVFYDFRMLSGDILFLTGILGDVEKLCAVYQPPLSLHHDTLTPLDRVLSAGLKNL